MKMNQKPELPRVAHAPQSDLRKETLKAARTVTKKRAKWLSEKGYVEDTALAQEQAREATRDLPLDPLDGFFD